MRETILADSFKDTLRIGFDAVSTGITEVLKQPFIVGVIGVGIAYFVAKKAIRLIKAR